MPSERFCLWMRQNGMSSFIEFRIFALSLLPIWNFYAAFWPHLNFVNFVFIICKQWRKLKKWRSQLPIQNTLGSVISNQGEPRSCLGRVFHFKLDSYVSNVTAWHICSHFQIWKLGPGFVLLAKVCPLKHTF